MQIYGSLDSLLAYQIHLRALRREAREEKREEVERVQLKQSTAITTKPNALDDILSAKVGGFADILHHIERDIITRLQVSERVSTDIDTQYCYVKTKFFAMYLWPVGVSGRSTESRRSALEKLLNDLNKEKREEQVACWQDVAKLREESRRWLKQYSDVKLRAAIMTKPMEEQVRPGQRSRELP